MGDTNLLIFLQSLTYYHPSIGAPGQPHGTLLGRRILYTTQLMGIIQLHGILMYLFPPSWCITPPLALIGQP